MFHRFRTLLLPASLSLFALCGVSTQAAAQVGSSANATTTVVDPAAIAKISDLDFGTIDANSESSTIVMTPHETAGNNGASDSGSAASLAAIHISGANDQSYSISLPRQARTLSRQNGTDTVSVHGFTSDLPEGMLVSGNREVRIGATLSLNDEQAPGTYTDEAGIPVTINYN